MENVGSRHKNLLDCRPGRFDFQLLAPVILVVGQMMVEVGVFGNINRKDDIDAGAAKLQMITLVRGGKAILCSMLMGKPDVNIVSVWGNRPKSLLFEWGGNLSMNLLNCGRHLISPLLFPVNHVHDIADIAVEDLTEPEQNIEVDIFVGADGGHGGTDAADALHQLRLVISFSTRK